MRGCSSLTMSMSGIPMRPTLSSAKRAGRPRRHRAARTRVADLRTSPRHRARPTISGAAGHVPCRPRHHLRPTPGPSQQVDHHHRLRRAPSLTLPGVESLHTAERPRGYARRSSTSSPNSSTATPLTGAATWSPTSPCKYPIPIICAMLGTPAVCHLVEDCTGATALQHYTVFRVIVIAPCQSLAIAVVQ
jgi:hypothetical protein